MQLLQKLLLGVVYRSPYSTIQTDKNLTDSISEQCENSPHDTLIVGDFNMAELSCSPRPDPLPQWIQPFDEVFSDFGLEQLVDTPTRGENILDLVLCNDPLLVSKLLVSTNLGKSDHECITFTINAKATVPPPPRRPLFGKGDYVSLNDYFGSVDWENLLNSGHKFLVARLSK